MSSNQSVYSEIVNLVPTTYQLDNFISEIDTLIESLFTTKGDITEKINNVFAADKNNVASRNIKINRIR